MAVYSNTSELPVERLFGRVESENLFDGVHQRLWEKMKTGGKWKRERETGERESKDELQQETVAPWNCVWQDMKVALVQGWKSQQKPIEKQRADDCEGFFNVFPIIFQKLILRMSAVEFKISPSFHF